MLKFDLKKLHSFQELSGKRDWLTEDDALDYGSNVAEFFFYI